MHYTGLNDVVSAAGDQVIFVHVSLLRDRACEEHAHGAHRQTTGIFISVLLCATVQALHLYYVTLLFSFILSMTILIGILHVV
jgi:hypothetical protein